MRRGTHPAVGSLAKRSLDVAVSALAITLLAPVMGAIALWIRITLGTPVLFKQVRPGLDGSPFTLLKFRTMHDGMGPDGVALPDEARITRVGRALRRSSLDELPELLNIITGNMSLVGPRPLLVDYLDLYTARQARRHEVRPGLTGLTQVSGRNALTWEQKFEYDVVYVENWSLRLDLRILAKSFLEVFARRGISAAGHATMPRFLGTSASDQDGGAS